MPKFSKFFSTLKGLLSPKQSTKMISKISPNNRDNQPSAFKDLVNLDIVNTEKPKKVRKGLKSFIKDILINLEQQMRSLYWLQRMKHIFIISAPVPSSYNKYENLYRQERFIDSVDRRLSLPRMRSVPAKAEVIKRKFNTHIKKQRISYKKQLNNIKDPYKTKSLGENSLRSEQRRRLSFQEKLLSLQQDNVRTR